MVGRRRNQRWSPSVGSNPSSWTKQLATATSTKTPLSKLLLILPRHHKRIERIPSRHRLRPRHRLRKPNYHQLHTSNHTRLLNLSITPNPIIINAGSSRNLNNNRNIPQRIHRISYPLNSNQRQAEWTASLSHTNQ